MIISTAISAPSPDVERWRCYPIASSVDYTDLLSEDMLREMFLKADGVELLRKCKSVCKRWRCHARSTLTEVDWLLANDVGLHALLRLGGPSPCLTLALAVARPLLLHERDADGMLPLQYAAAYQKNEHLVAELRKAMTGVVLGSGSWSSSVKARKLKLRPVVTRISQGIVAA